MPSLNYFKATIEQLFRPFQYLKIKHSSKKIIDWYIPFALTIILFLFIFLGKYSSYFIFDKYGFLSELNSFLYFLPGFYIAALAAVATFGSSTMDSLIKAPVPTIKEVREGVLTDIALTRRRFLSLLFSFLTAQSIILIIFYNFFMSINLINKVNYFQCLPDILFSFYMIFFFQVIAVTFFGLFYLGDRIHKN